MGLEDLLNKLLFMAVCDDGTLPIYLDVNLLMTLVYRSRFYIPFSSYIPTLRKPTYDSACYAETYARA